MELRLYLNTIEKQEKFNKIINGAYYDKYDIDIYINTPEKPLDAKSMMSVISLGTDHCVYVYINNHKPSVLERFEIDMSEFMMEK